MPLSLSKPEVHFEDQCVICYESLIVSNNDDESSKSFYIIDDDVQLRCDHHFHKSCIMRYALSSSSARERCAMCHVNILDNSDRYIIDIKIENECVDSMNLEKNIDEQVFLKANLNVAHAQVFLSLMLQMNFIEAEKLLKSENDMKCDKFEVLSSTKLDYEIDRLRVTSFRLELALIVTETSAVINLLLCHSFFSLLLFLYLRIFD